MKTLLEEKLRAYNANGEYKGFYKVIEHEGGNMTHLTLTNGDQDISASGIFKNDALRRAFDKIDTYRSN